MKVLPRALPDAVTLVSLAFHVASARHASCARAGGTGLMSRVPSTSSPGSDGLSSATSIGLRVVERALDVRERDVHDRHVEERDEHAEAAHADRDPTAARASVRL